MLFVDPGLVREPWTILINFGTELDDFFCKIYIYVIEAAGKSNTIIPVEYL